MCRTLPQASPIVWSSIAAAKRQKKCWSRRSLASSSGFITASDLIGNEVGAAAKNVIGIAAGMLDGKNKTALKGALMARGTREVARPDYSHGRQ